jgi:microfibrillar-associated protein 1
MQKYYNKGIFFQERDDHGKLKEIFMRDYNKPVEGDFDKTTLPKILQKRRGDFGKKGQSKYTHLTNEDTTNFDPQFMPQPELLMKQQMKGAAYKAMNSFDAKKRN